MAVSLRDMQLLAERQYSVEETRKDMNRMVDWFCSQPEQEHYLEVAVHKERKLPVSIARAQKVFFVNDEMVSGWLPDEFRAESLGFVRGNNVIFAGRLVYPVMDVMGDVMGFCGWDKVNKPKYLDSRNQGYKAKHATFYGMETLNEAYRNNQPVYIVEGIVCCLYLRSQGLQAYAMLGSNLTPYVLAILRRFGSRLVVIPDNDTVGKSVTDINDNNQNAGNKFVAQIKKELPLAKVIQSVIAKDIDDTRLYNNGEYEQQFLQELRQVVVNPFMVFKTVRLR